MWHCQGYSPPTLCAPIHFWLHLFPPGRSEMFEAFSFFFWPLAFCAKVPGSGVFNYSLLVLCVTNERLKGIFFWKTGLEYGPFNTRRIQIHKQWLLVLLWASAMCVWVCNTLAVDLHVNQGRGDIGIIRLDTLGWLIIKKSNQLNEDTCSLSLHFDGAPQGAPNKSV